jgi:hypothetical protein
MDILITVMYTGKYAILELPSWLIYYYWILGSIVVFIIMLSVTIRQRLLSLLVFHENCLQMCWSAAGFCKLLAALSQGANRGITLARTCQDRRKTICPYSGWSEMLGEPCINRPWCCHSDMVFWLGFAPLAFGSVKNMYHKAVVYNSAVQGRQSPWGTVLPAYPFLY